MGGMLPAPAISRLAFEGQSPVTLGRTPAVVTVGQGLVGRTIDGQLFLDGSNEAVADVVNLSAPGVVSARTLGKWRQRSAKGAGTLSVLEANLATAPTVSGDAANYWRVVVTDTKGSAIILPISTAGQGYYELDRSAGQAVIDPWNGLPNGVGYGTGGEVGHRWGFVPTQGMSIGGFTVLMSVRGDSSSLSAQIRGALYEQRADGTWNRLAEARVWTLGGGNSVARSGAETITFRFPLTVPVAPATRYFVTVDVFETFAGTGTINLFGPDAIGNGTVAPVAGTPANVYLAGPTSTGQVRPSVAANSGAPNALTDTINDLTWEALAGVAPGTNTDAWNVPAFTDAMVPAGCWAVNGTLSGTAPVYGDLTFAIAAAGAPAAGTAGADLNLRAVILP